MIPTPPPGPVHWLFLDLDSYFASCEQQARPDLRGKPIGVVPMMAETTCCLAASRQAKKFGVKTGVLVAEARILCPEITFVVSRHDLYTLYHKMILEAVDTCVPIDSVLSIDEMICELTGSQREVPAALALTEKIKNTLRERVGDVLTCSVGLACNRYLAKLASDMNKPNGVTLLRQDLPHSLFPLKLHDFPGIGPRMEQRLLNYGITTTEMLWQLSMKEMAKAWGGVVGERFYRWLRGEEISLPESVHRSLGHQHVLEPELRTPEGSWITAKKLLVKAAMRLRKEGSYARRVNLHIRFLGNQDSWQSDIRVDETQDTLTLLSALKTLWAKRPRGNPIQVGVTFYDLVPRNRHQLSLLVNPNRENLGDAMDRMNRKYGKETVSVGGLYEYRSAAPTRIPFHRIPDLEEF